ncbi:MAG: hypothetical protein JXA51_02175 [Dehalococcoidales bacterium]|nr:hypothetical protein [Dehalococcoidales bacterium]
MDSVKSEYRPYSSWETGEIVKRACDAAINGDIESLSYCLAELSPKHRNIDLTTWLDITESAQKLGLYPVDWLAKAAATTGRFTPRTTGKHNLYIVLLHELKGKIPGYGLYVGETSKSPEARFKEHSERKRNRKGPLFSRIVFKHQKCLLPTLYNHLNPLSRTEAKKLEVEIAEALRLEGIPVYGGH